ncbi:hypothetical protein V8G54_002572 [Vigna mungo]|uniref:Uncharacterized protein n=1 Tax=Vigna mungo TaxID=3915 RepID=A0AAQ3P9H9_VIGMU
MGKKCHKSEREGSVEVQGGFEVEIEGGVEVESDGGEEVDGGVEVDREDGLEVETNGGEEVDGGVEVDKDGGLEVETNVSGLCNLQVGAHGYCLRTRVSAIWVVIMYVYDLLQISCLMMVRRNTWWRFCLDYWRDGLGFHGFGGGTFCSTTTVTTPIGTPLSPQC